MHINLIVAASTNNAIGKNNDLLWHLPQDMQFFKQTTWGMPVIMGRKTFESLKGKPLNGRLNIVLTKQKNFEAKEAIVVENLEDALFVAQQHLYKQVFIIGGGDIYKQTIKKASTIYLTRVHTIIDGDVFFPEISKNEFKLTSSFDYKANEKNAYDFSFEKWEKI
ncbi:MAG: dihydrofolate reductase [Chitinophagaceae bacterium]